MPLRLTVIATLFALLSPLSRAENITLASEGTARLTIWIPADASENHQASAAALSKMLGEMSGASFKIVTSNPPTRAIRLFVGSAQEPPGALGREQYTIKSDGSLGLTLIGATDLALQHAVWDLLHRLGYRQFFPGKAWEVIPKLDTVSIDIDATESPDYASRRIWYGYGFWDHNRPAWEDWVAKNRMEGGFTLNTGHAYGRLIASQQATFDAHPEYYALVNGERHIVPQAKLCISHPGVREAAIGYALEFFAQNPNADSVSIDPSDGGNWCECEACARIGPPNDRATLLANTVAEAVTQKLGPNHFVGMYAYNYHSEPPSIEVHSNVIISVATAFIKGGLKIDDLISGWSEKGATLGIREYYSVNTWDRDLPGAARGSDLDYLADTIPKFHAQGARFLSAESSDNWGCNGLGYYFASRVMWDVEAAKHRDALVEDFLEKAFGPAKEPMREYYQLTDGTNRKKQLVYDDLLARMFRHLKAARDLAVNATAERERIDQLILYTRHAELFDRYRNARGAERQTAYEAMIRHAYRVRDTFMIHSYALWRDVPNRDKAIQHPENAGWKIPESENPWKQNEPITADEIESILGSGVANHQPVELGFEPVEFDDQSLVSAASLHQLPKDLPELVAANARGARAWYTVIDQTPTSLQLQITGGLIEHYRDRGNIKIGLWKIGGPSETGEDRTLVAEDASVPPDGEEHVVSFTIKEPGIYRIDLNDGSDLTRVTWPSGQRMSWKMSLDDYPHMMSGRWSLYAWVPQGTKKIGLFSAAGGGELRRPDGEKALDLATPGGAFLSVDVPEGMDGQLWKFHSVAGRVSLLTIPPYLARSPDELVLPAE